VGRGGPVHGKGAPRLHHGPRHGVGIRLAPRVHPGGIGAEGLLPALRQPPKRMGRVSRMPRDAGFAVGLDPIRAKHGGQPPGGLAADQLHLQQAVLRRGAAQTEEAVRLGLGEDMRCPPGIPQHLDRVGRSGGEDVVAENQTQS